jgi:hypothetical protein
MGSLNSLLPGGLGRAGAKAPRLSNLPRLPKRWQPPTEPTVVSLYNHLEHGTATTTQQQPVACSTVRVYAAGALPQVEIETPSI